MFHIDRGRCFRLESILRLLRLVAVVRRLARFRRWHLTMDFRGHTSGVRVVEFLRLASIDLRRLLVLVLLGVGILVAH